MIYIENVLTKKVFGSTNDGKVIPEDYEEGKANQLWKKGKPDAENFFTLENSGVPKVMTAISSSGLEIKGNITLRCTNNCWLFTIFFLHIDLNNTAVLVGVISWSNGCADPKFPGVYARVTHVLDWIKKNMVIL